MALALRVAPSDEAIKKGSWERPERGFDTEFSRGPQAEGFNLKAKEQQSYTMLSKFGFFCHQLCKKDTFVGLS